LTPGNITRFFIAYSAAKTISTAVSFIPFATKVKALSVVAFNPWVLATVGVGIAAYSIFSAIKEHNERRKKNKEIDAQRQMENELGITSYKSGEQIYNRYATFNMGR
jgi:large-conductance mechanosensitive channel